MTNKRKKVAICVVGSLRSFLNPNVRNSIEKYFIDALAPKEDRQVFFDVDISGNPSNIHTKALAKNGFDRNTTINAEFFEEYKLRHPEHSYNSLSNSSSFDCSHPYLKSHSCCQPDVGGFKGHVFAYARKSHCYEEMVLKTNYEFDYIAVIRPDMVWFREVDSIQRYIDKNKIDAIYVSSKDAGNPIGDYAYLVPRSKADYFFSLLKNLYNTQCSTSKTIGYTDYPGL